LTGSTAHKKFCGKGNQGKKQGRHAVTYEKLKTHYTTGQKQGKMQQTQGVVAMS
jgi:hypothetical protein